MCPVYLQKIQVPPLQGAVRNFKVYQNDENVNRESTESRKNRRGIGCGDKTQEMPVKRARCVNGEDAGL